MWIYVMRHGIAHDREADDCPPDPQRRLTEVGRRRTREAARGLNALSPDVDVCLSSPYVRALQTMDIARDAIGLKERPLEVTESLLPEAPPEDVLALLRELRPGGALLVGHAPHVDRLITLLLTGHDGQQTWMKKAAVARLEVKQAVEPGKALLRWLIPPKALRALG